VVAVAERAARRSAVGAAVVTPEYEHRITFTARWFRWLPWPARTQTYAKTCSCDAARAIVAQLRDGGARVRVECDRPRRVP
jgi:hypothetical protein